MIADKASKLLPLGLDLRTDLVVAAPRALQAAFAALGDWYTWQLAVTIYADSNVSSFAVSDTHTSSRVLSPRRSPVGLLTPAASYSSSSSAPGSGTALSAPFPTRSR